MISVVKMHSERWTHDFWQFFRWIIWWERWSKMIRKRDNSPDFKARVALNTIREKLTLGELSKKCSVHFGRISTWKQAALDNMCQRLDVVAAILWLRSAQERLRSYIRRLSSLLQNGIFWPTPRFNCPGREAKMVSKDHKLSIRRQCALLTLARSNLYYQPKG